MAAGKGSADDQLQEMKDRLKQAEWEKSEAQKKLTIAQEEMKKSGAVSAEQQTKLRTWPGVDWTVPAYAVWLMIGEDKPAQGKVAVTEKGAKHELIFDGGWTVTNSLDSARRIVRNLKTQHSISEVKR